MGKLLNFSWSVYPNSCICVYVSDISELTLSEFVELLSKINFTPTSENELKQLLFEYKFACEMVVDCRAQNSLKDYTPNMFKTICSSVQRRCLNI